MKDQKRRGPEIPGTLRVDEAAARLGVALNTMYSWVANGTVPHLRIGTRMIRVRAEVLDGLIRDVPAKYEDKASAG